MPEEITQDAKDVSLETAAGQAANYERTRKSMAWEKHIERIRLAKSVKPDEKSMFLPNEPQMSKSREERIARQRENTLKMRAMNQNRRIATPSPPPPKEKKRVSVDYVYNTLGDGIPFRMKERHMVMVEITEEKVKVAVSSPTQKQKKKHVCKKGRDTHFPLHTKKCKCVARGNACCISSAEAEKTSQARKKRIDSLSGKLDAQREAERRTRPAQSSHTDDEKLAEQERRRENDLQRSAQIADDRKTAAERRQHAIEEHRLAAERSRNMREDQRVTKMERRNAPTPTMDDRDNRECEHNATTHKRRQFMTESPREATQRHIEERRQKRAELDRLAEEKRRKEEEIKKKRDYSSKLCTETLHRGFPKSLAAACQTPTRQSHSKNLADWCEQFIGLQGSSIELMRTPSSGNSRITFASRENILHHPDFCQCHRSSETATFEPITPGPIASQALYDTKTKSFVCEHRPGQSPQSRPVSPRSMRRDKTNRDITAHPEPPPPPPPPPVKQESHVCESCNPSRAPTPPPPPRQPTPPPPPPPPPRQPTPPPPPPPQPVEHVCSCHRPTPPAFPREEPESIFTEHETLLPSPKESPPHTCPHCTSAPPPEPPKPPEPPEPESHWWRVPIDLTCKCQQTQHWRSNMQGRVVHRGNDYFRFTDRRTGLP